MKTKTNLWIGIAFLVLGGLFLLDKLGIFSVDIWDIIVRFWYVILIIFGIKLLASKSNLAISLIFIIVGVLLLLGDIFGQNLMSLIWPLVLMAIGVSFIFRNENKEEDNIIEAEIIEENKEDKKQTDTKIKDSVIFWAKDKKIKDTDFKGGDISTVFGEYDLDLSEVKIKNKAKLKLNAIFGEINIIVPKDCRVITNGSGIFGDWKSKLKETDIKSPTLEIIGSAVFGNVKVSE